MSEQRPVQPAPATSEAAALRQTGALSLRPGDPGRIGPYVPLALLGRGGMGRVYLARPVDGSPGLAAVKVIRPEYADDADFRRRFEREASVHARVCTPHTPRLCGTGFQDELLWMATEYLPGLDLAAAVRGDGALQNSAVWRLAAELGRALADLAAGGIVHRDLKPSNVLLSVRGAYVIDFGLSKAADASALTGTGNRVGTPAYMSPEHLRTGRCDTASDVFSLAGTLVYAATGRAPFGDGTGVDVMHRVAFEEPNPELLGEISATDTALGSLLSACLAKEPGRRPAPQDLVDAAGAHADTSRWPEPLAGRVLARQRAYDVLSRIPAIPAIPTVPAERKARLRSPDDRQKALPHTPNERVSRSAPPASGPPTEVARPSAATPPEQGRAREARTWTRRKRVLAVAAAVALCTLSAGVLVVTRQDTPATASSPGAGATSAGTAPAGAALEPAPGASYRTSASGTSGKSAHVAGGTVGEASPPEPSNSADADPRSAALPPGPETGAPGEPAPSPSNSATDPAAPPWISDCTYYSGSGRTRQGDSGERVQQVQCMLTQRGYGVGSTGVNGDFGPGTESAVRSFQSDKGLVADGVVGRQTWAALRSTE